MPRKSRSAPRFGLFALFADVDVAGVVGALDDLDRQRHQHDIGLDRSLRQRADLVGNGLDDSACHLPLSRYRRQTSDLTRRKDALKFVRRYELAAESHLAS